jgi:hypothetical protein
MDTRFMILAALVGFGGALLLAGLMMRNRRTHAQARADKDKPQG